MPAKSPIRHWCCALLWLLALAAQPARAQNKEYEIKAAFLLNFVQFVQWPEDSFPRPASPFCIGILGDNPFGDALEETVRDEKVGSHPLTVRHARRVGDLLDCQLIFVSKSESRRAPEILTELGSRPVMTVGDVTGFAQQGGTINFYRAENKVRFEINPAAARQCGLKISSQLLALGKIVETAGK